MAGGQQSGIYMRDASICAVYYFDFVVPKPGISLFSTSLAQHMYSRALSTCATSFVLLLLLSWEFKNVNLFVSTLVAPAMTRGSL